MGEATYLSTDHPQAMEGTCEHSDICGRDALDGHDGKCILHSEDADKDEEDFEEALEKHLEERGPDLRHVVFPLVVDFDDATFDSEVDLRGATFESIAGFEGCDFNKKVWFRDATFEAVLNLKDAAFESRAHFQKITCKAPTDFTGCTFKAATSFHGATFEALVGFSDAQFKQATFKLATFEGEALFARCFKNSGDTQFVDVIFAGCEFQDDVLISGQSKYNRAFASGEVDFSETTVSPDATVIFRYADLSRCRFLRTDLRDFEFTGVKWCEEISSDGRWFDEWFRRDGIYDEVYEQNQDDNAEGGKADEEKESDSEVTSPWSEIERLYRQLKRNYEDRGDFPRGGDFHIGEKVARRQSSQTHWGVQVLLFTYRALSKYGERALPATLWLLGLVPGLALLYFLFEASTCTLCGPVSYPEALLSSVEATFYPVRPVGFEEKWAQFLSVVQRIISPILIALLALALRQRVKR